MKKFRKLTFVLVAICASLMIMVGCTPEPEEEKDKPPTPTGLIMVDGNLSWTPVAIADKYYVYAGNTRIEETTSTAVLVEDKYHDSMMSVESVADDVRSDLSAPALVVKTVHDDPARILSVDVTEETTFTIGVPTNINKLVVTGELGRTYTNSKISVNARTAPLTIELINVDASARHGTVGVSQGSNIGNGGDGGDGDDFIAYGGTGRIPQLTIVSSGEYNRLHGGNGGNGGKGGARRTGGSGGKGGVAVHANNLIVMGSTDLILKGGNGGKGGNGHNAGDLLTYSTNGGKGGNAAVTVDADTLFINQGVLTRAILNISTGGKGGTGYRNGQLGSLSGTSGSNGTDGAQYNGTLITLSGTVSQE